MNVSKQVGRVTIWVRIDIHTRACSNAEGFQNCFIWVRATGDPVHVLATDLQRRPRRGVTAQ